MSRKIASIKIITRDLLDLLLFLALSLMTVSNALACDNCGHKKKILPIFDSAFPASLRLANNDIPIPVENKPPSAALHGSTDTTTLQGGAQSTSLQGGTQSTTLQGGTNQTTLQGGTQSTTLQGGTNQTTLQGGTQSTLLQGGSNATLLQTGTKSTTLDVGTTATLIQGGVQKETVPVNVLILIDSSMTMKQGMDGSYPAKMEEKMEAAKKVLKDTVYAIPQRVKLGLRVFGGGTSNDTDTDCRQTALLIPIASGNRNTLMRVALGLKPAGMTPLAYALSQVPDDFKDLHGVRRVILLSDGMDTCGGDPCAYIRALSKMGYKMKIDIVGLGLKHDKIARQALDCIAENSGGKYYDADTAAELAKSLKQSFADAVNEGTVTGQVLPRKRPSDPASK